MTPTTPSVKPAGDQWRNLAERTAKRIIQGKPVSDFAFSVWEREDTDYSMIAAATEKQGKRGEK